MAALAALALEVLGNFDYQTDGLRSKGWDEFASPGCAGDGFRLHRPRFRGRRGLSDLARPDIGYTEGASSNRSKAG